MKLNNYPIGVLLVLDYVAISQSAYLDIFTIFFSLKESIREAILGFSRRMIYQLIILAK